MKTKYLLLKTCIPLLAAIMLLPTASDAQTPKFRVMMTITDSIFNTSMVFRKVQSDTTVFGLHPDATYCTDLAALTGYTDHWVDNWRGSVYNETMVEEEYPPEAPQFAFYVKNARSGCPGNPLGYFNMIHQYISPDQLDTVKLKVKSIEDEFSRITIRWPKVLSEYFTTARFTGTLNSVLYDLNMLTDSSISFEMNSSDNPSGYTFTIYTAGPKVPSGPPAPPTAIFPLSGATELPDTVTMHWSAGINPYYYHLQVARDSTFKKNIVKDTTLGQNFYKLYNLLAETTYYWRVSLKNEYGISYYPASPFRFQIKASTPPIPNRLYPDTTGDNSKNIPVNPTFRWNRSQSASAVTYRVQFSDNVNFSTILRDSTTFDTVMAVNGIFVNCNNYYWRINATNANGSSAWSTIWMFKSAWFTPAVPDLAAPSNGALNVSLTPSLSWTGDICTENFRLTVGRDTDFTQVVYDALQTQTSKTLPALEQDANYFWKVKSKNPLDSSEYSERWSFTTLLNPAAVPVLVSPADADTGRSPVDEIIWRKVQYAESYHLQIALDQNFSSIISNDSTLTDTVFTTPSLTNCVRYYWHVRAKNRSGSAGYSVVRNFKIETAVPGAPLLDSPANGQDSLLENVTLRWHAGDPCTNSYKYHVSTRANFTDTISIGATASTSVDLTQLQGNVYYFWHVMAVNYLGESAYSETFQFHTTKSRPLVPVLLEPVNDLGDVSSCMTFMWDSATFAATYRLQVARDSFFTNLFFDDSLIARQPGVRPSRQVCSLPNATRMYWRVNAKNEIGVSPWSPVRRFTTLYPPADIILNMPIDAEEDVSLKPVFSWSIASRADHYRLQVARDPSMNDLVFDDSTLVELSWAITDPLMNFTKYYWRVSGKNSAGWGNWSIVNSFTTTRVGIANWLIPLTISESGPERQTIYFGLHPEATSGLDPDRGEYELPPPLYGYFDARFISPYIGEGLLVEYHEFIRYTQRDTFQFRYQPGLGSFPMTISWYHARVKDVCDSMVITDRLISPSIRTRMDIDSFVVVNNSSIGSLYILTYDAYPFVDVTPIIPEVPKGFVLYQNYPNPFNPSTKIHFSTDKDSRITISVYDILGREVAAITHRDYQAGGYTFDWNGKNSEGLGMPSGIYYLRMIATPLSPGESGSEPYVATRKMIMMK